MDAAIGFNKVSEQINLISGFKDTIKNIEPVENSYNFGNHKGGLNFDIIWPNEDVTKVLVRYLNDDAYSVEVINYKNININYHQEILEVDSLRTLFISLYEESRSLNEILFSMLTFDISSDAEEDLKELKALYNF